MAISLNPGKYTRQQIEAAEPILKSIEKYDRMIAQERVCGNVLNEPFEKAKLRKDRIANYETKKRELCKELERILDMRNLYDDMFKTAERAVNDLQIIKERWGF